MALLDTLNLNYLRIFMAVYRTGSMTQAARELHLTQSGISQQIKSLDAGAGAARVAVLHPGRIPDLAGTGRSSPPGRGECLWVWRQQFSLRAGRG